MDILVKDKHVVCEAPHIDFGIFENEQKWRLMDENNVLCYYMDNDYALVENVDLPDDYVEGKYFYESGEFVVNSNYKPYVSNDERIANVEEQTKTNADTLDFLFTELLPNLFGGFFN